MDDQFDQSEEIIDVPQSKVEKAKAFLAKNSTPIAVGVTSALAFSLGRKTGLGELAKIKISRDQVIAHLEEAFDDTAKGLGIAMDFIDSKNLTKQYTKFHNEAAGLA